MSRYPLLLGAATVALASLTTMATPASAQSKSKFDVLVGGDVYFEAGIANQDRDSGLRSTEFRNRLRVTLTPTATADNGLEYGARLRFGTDTPATNRVTVADRAFIFAKGAFGTIHAGQENGPSDDSGIIAPSDWGTGGVDGSFPAWLGNSGANAPSTIANIRALISGNDSTRIAYYSPRLAGFQLGVSFQPNSDSSNTDVNRLKIAAPNGNRTGAYRDSYEVGGTYSDTLGGATVNASLFYLGGKAKNSSTTAATYEDLSSAHAGLSVAYGGLKVGGSYAWSGDSGYVKQSSLAAATSREKQDVWTVGAQYTVGPTTIGAGYLNARDAGSLTVAGKTKFELYTVGARYVIAPGFNIGPEYNHFKLASDVAANSDKGDIFLVQTNLAF